MTNRLSYEAFKPSQHHCRLAVRVIGLADQQSDLTEDFKGPSKKIALMQMETSQKQRKDSSVEKA